MADKDQRRNPRRRSTVEEPQASSSDRVRLEVSILASATDEAHATEEADEPSAERADQRTVLVVAAEADVCTYVRRCLRRTGMHVLEAADGEAAFEATRIAFPDLVIIDVAVPDPVGTALGHALRAEPALAHVAVIVIRDEAPGDGGAQVLGGVALGAILLKPFNARQLCAAVERLLNLPPGAEPRDHP